MSTSTSTSMKVRIRVEDEIEHGIETPLHYERR
jgi:hypothetical protein